MDTDADALNEAFHHASRIVDRVAIHNAQLEIERLRASQFRWIPIEPLPQNSEMDRKFLITDGKGVSVSFGFAIRNHAGITHFAPIPPLPEKSQDKKDEGLWTQFCGKQHLNQSVGPKDAFLAGLKAAREAKP